jgi:8-oxo-dGTP pyrophosphatase MutT (NUDIX family)
MSEKKGPWTVNQKTLVYENPWIAVTHHDVTNPAGKPGLYGTVSFHNRAVAVVPLADNKDIWLVGQHRFPLDEYHWEVPMGGAPKNESAEACALRELKEETGLTAQRLTRLGHKLHLSNCISDEEGFIFVAEDLTEGETEMEDTEQLTIRRLPFEEAYQMVEQGQITDALSVLAILKMRLQGLA